MSSTTYELTTGIWRKITTAGEAGTCWVTELSDSIAILINHTLTPGPDTIPADGGSAEIAAGLDNHENAFPLGFKDRVISIPIDTDEDVYYALFIDNRPNTPNTAKITVDLPRGMGGFPKNIDVALQDQHTPSIIANFNQIENSTTLASPASREDLDIVVTSITGITIGKYIILFYPPTERFYFGYAVNVVSNTITLDSPLDSDFPAGTFVDSAITDMAVNGAITPQVFGLRGTGAPPGVDLKVDVTRIIFTCVATSAVTLSLFANITALTNGLLLRQRNVEWFNIFNVKSNREMAGIMFDFAVSQAINPAQGEDGFAGRLTFAGQNKIGVTKRLPIGEDLEFVVQDDLSLITSLHVIAEGHIVEP